MASKNEESLLAQLPPEASECFGSIASELGVSEEEVRQRFLNLCRLARERLEENKKALGLERDAEVISFDGHREAGTSAAARTAATRQR